MTLLSTEIRGARSGANVDNLVDLLRSRADAQPTKTAYVFLDDGEREGARCSFEDLDCRARAIAARLCAEGAKGERALLLYPPGLAYIEAFLGCLYAGVVAVPAYPPSGRHFERLSSIFLDSNPSVMLTTQEMRLRFAASDDKGFAGATARWIATDEIESGSAGDWRPFAPGAEDVAFLQYTSGSTAEPRGVMITHANLLSNQALIEESFGHDANSDLVGWLPLYHDMGLIGNVLQPLYVGSTAYLMSPMAFLAKPLRWLKAISTYGAQTSGGPNFAYDLCVRKITEEDKRDLDLSAWRIAFSGAEPVRSKTLERFAHAFADCGFRPEAFTPCYGLAEATLVVTAPAPGRPTPVIEIDRTALEHGRALRATSSKALSFVGCGHVWPGYDVAIVDPERRIRCSHGVVGEIWVAGPGVACGYRGKPEDTARVFQATILGEENRPYLRTGDLGFFDNGDLFVAGRSKDLIIVAGRNVHAHDVEAAIEHGVAGVRPGCTAAFSITEDDEEQLVVVAEPDRATAGADERAHADILGRIRRSVAEDVGIEPAHVVLARPGSVPKTSSGKLRRADCRRRYRDDELAIIARWDRAASWRATETTARADPGSQSQAFLRRAMSFVDAGQRPAMLRSFLLSSVAELLDISPSELSHATSLAHAGLSSLRIIELKHRIDAALDIDTPIELLLSEVNAAIAADALLKMFEAASSDALDSARGGRVASGLSFSQRAMWTIHRLDGASEVYNLHLALRLEDSIDAERLCAAIRRLAERHAQLRTIYRACSEGGTAESIVLDRAPEIMRVQNASHWSEAELRAEMSAEAHRPFDIESEAPLRVVLYRLAKERCALLFVAHHIALDQWSLALLLGDLDRLYRSPNVFAQNFERAGADYNALVACEADYLASTAAQDDWAYWRQQLDGPLPTLELPRDGGRESVPDYRGGSAPLLLDRNATRDLRALAKHNGVSLYSVLLAVYFVLLQRLSGQTDIIVGGATSGRLNRASAAVVGNCVNAVAIRSKVEPRESFVDLLRRVNDQVKGAIVHQRLPFQLIVERLKPKRVDDQWPIYQTWFVLQQTQGGMPSAAAILALGEEIGSIDLLGASATPVALTDRVEMFDLKVMAAEHDEQLVLSFQYRKQALSRSVVTSMAERFARLVEAFLESPEACIGDVDIVAEAEKRAILAASTGDQLQGNGAALLHEMISRTAKADDLAVVVDNGAMTYDELDRRSNQIARLLRQRGVGPDAPVGVLVDPGVDYVAAVLGVLKAGGAFVPLDPAYPPERLDYMLSDAKARALISRRERKLSASDIPAVFVDPEELVDVSTGPVDVTVGPDNLAYIVYTSGSTGRAKGVMATHRNAVASLLARFQFYPTPVADFLLLSSLSFDSSFAGLFWTLAQGGRLHLVSESTRRDPYELANLIDDRKISHLLCLPSLYRELLGVLAGRVAKAQCCIVAGEACRLDVVERHFTIAPDAALYNEYGPTECSVWCTAGQVHGNDDRSSGVGIGRAIAGTRVVIVDDRGGVAPLGVAGELYVGGAGVVRGYLDRPDLTAEKFVPDPFGGTGARLYRSGDRARYRSDGNLEFLGRGDEQVKIRGHRVEISEVENTLSRLPLIREAAVVARADAAGDKRLIAYVVGVGDIDAREVKDAVRREAPDYLTPQFVVPLDRLPRLENGKIDRRALPTPELDALIADRYVAPASEAEAAVCAVFAEAVGLGRVGAEDDFFDLGGDSVRAIQASSGLRTRGYEVSPREIFQHPTAATLATRLRITTECEPASTALERRVASFVLSGFDACDIERLKRLHGDVEDAYPLTPMQEGMLFHAISQRGTGLYLMQDRYEIKGRLNVDAFGEAWRSVVARHAILRTSFDWFGEGRPHQIVHRSVTLPFDARDLRGLSEREQAEEIDCDLATERQQGFDLAAAPLMRIRIYRLAAERHICVRSFHHIILDDWCTSPLILDVRRHYAAATRGETVDLPTPPQFRRYIEWIEAKRLDAAEKFWRNYLDGFVEATPLIGAKRSQNDATSLVEDVTVDLSEDVYDRAKALVQRNRLTLNTFVQGALALTLGRAAGVDDVVFGVTVSGRPTDLEGAESTLGLFINSLPLRVRIDPRKHVVDWLREILSDNLDIRQYEFVSQTKIQQWSSVSRSNGLIFQHLLTFENAPLDPSVRGEKDVLDIDLLQLRVHTNYPLTFVAIPGETLSLRLTYDRDRFNEETVRRMAEAFRRSLEQLIVECDRRICELDLLSSSDRRLLTVAWNATDHDYGDPLDFVARFEARAATEGDRVAASCGSASIRYAELNARANRLAHALTAHGVGPDVVVGLLDDRGIDFLVAILAIFKAGGTYLPLDPAHPDARIAQVLVEGGVPLLAVGAAHRSRAQGLLAGPQSASLRALDLTALEAEESRADNPARRHSAGDVAFVIYTSGSTGKPKGAMVEHRGMFNNLITKVPALGLTRDDVIAQTASQCFDISVWQFLTALTIGARVEIFPDDISRDPERLLEQIEAKGVTIFETVPSMIRVLLDVTESRPRLRGLRWLLPCGEAFAPELCRLFMERFAHVRLLNAYGPAECSDDVSYYPIETPPEGDDLSVPIGRPVDNTRLYIVDRWLDLAPVGAAGEICVAGIQVGRGYLNRPDLTAASFVPDSFGDIGGRLYRTGDLGRRRPDGVIEFLGRIDHQVKIRGNRIEPGEVEARLASHPAVRAACVVIREVSKGVHRLVAYVESAADKFSSEELRLHIRATLPAFMVPEAFVRLDALPLSPNGKIDRKALPAPTSAAAVLSRRVAPRNPTEETIAQIWMELLSVRQVGANDNFFDLGGHSLLAARIVSRIRSIFAIELPLRELLDASDLADLAARVDEARGRRSASSFAPIVRASRAGPMPLSNAQQRLWFMQQRDPSSSAYHFTVAVRVAGALDEDILEAALKAVVQRHESLRTVFVTEAGRVAQKILPECAVRLHRQMLDGAIDTEGETRRAMMEFAVAPFDLERGPLVRCALYRSSAGDDADSNAAVLLCFHHIIFDGWSFTVFLREFAAIYSALRAGQHASLPPLAIQYADYAMWHAEQLQESAAAEHLSYWREHLRGAPPRLDLPTDRPRRSAIGYDAASYALDLAESQEAFDAFNRARAVTPFMTILSAFGALLRYWSGASDMVIGTDVANRPRVELESVIGFFVNLVALRVRLDGDPTFEETVERVRELTLSAYDHQSFPFDKLVEELKPDRDSGYPPIFQAKVAFHNVPTLEFDIVELEFEPMSLESSHAELDLVLHVYQRRQGLSVVFEYRSGLFDAATIERLAALFRTLLDAALERPQIALGELLDVVAKKDKAIRDAVRSEQLAARRARLRHVERRNMLS